MRANRSARSAGTSVRTCTDDRATPLGSTSVTKAHAASLQLLDGILNILDQVIETRRTGYRWYVGICANGPLNAQKSFLCVVAQDMKILPESSTHSSVLRERRDHRSAHHACHQVRYPIRRQWRGRCNRKHRDRRFNCSRNFSAETDARQHVDRQVSRDVLAHDVQFGSGFEGRQPEVLSEVLRRLFPGCQRSKFIEKMLTRAKQVLKHGPELYANPVVRESLLLTLVPMPMPALRPCNCDGGDGGYQRTDPRNPSTLVGGCERQPPVKARPRVAKGSDHHA